MIWRTATLPSANRSTVLRGDKMMAAFTAIICKHQSGGAMPRQSAYNDRRQFRHFAQSFAQDDPITPAEANAIGLELAQREFSGFEDVIATHVDTNHIHNHLVVNSVRCVDGRTLHQSADDLLAHRKAKDEICQAHGLNIVIWTESRKHITFLCPNGRRCRDSSLHDETFLKENMEALFIYQQMIGFRGKYSEPEKGLLRLGKQLEQDADQLQLPEPPVWTDSKPRRRETMKKTAHGQKLNQDSHTQSQGMMGY